MKLWIPVLAVVLAFGAQAQGIDDVQRKLSAAKPGDVVVLPAGTIAGSVVVPAGVSLKGAGVDKTIIDAKGQVNGILVEGGSNARISDLTIKNAMGTGVVLNATRSTTVARVRATACSNGLLVTKSEKARMENCLVDQGSFGIVVNGGSDCVVVNCTVANCTEMGMSLAATRNAVIFNNCIAGSGKCLNIDTPANLQSDHNLYFGLFIGQMNEQTPKKILTGWQYVTALDNKPGLDLHSVSMPVAFKNIEAGDFTTTTVVPWALDRAATGGWGTAQLAGVKAPTDDIQGKDRGGHLDVGAVQTTIQAPRTADGQFIVSKDEGVKSAGVFTKDGMLIAYLFQNLPLPKGTYSFWLPVRDFIGKTIPAGDYDVRLVESDFRWKYLAPVGDTGGDVPWGSLNASANPGMVAFGTKNTLIMLESLSEGHTALRSFDIATGKIVWSLPGSSFVQGLVVKDGVIYFLYEQNKAKGESRLTRVDVATGKVMPWAGSETGHMYPVPGTGAYSMAALGDRLYVANAAGNMLYVIKIADGTIEKTLPIASPKGVAGDDKNNVLWVISGDTLVAIDAAGKKVAESKVVPEPACVNTCNGMLAVASHKTGKIHILDAANPNALKQTRTIGQGDGPYGKVQPDRFFFQKAPGWGADPDDVQVSLALNAEGMVGVAEAGHRVLMFDKSGKNLWFTYGLFGNAVRPSFSTGNRRMWDMWTNTSFLMDEKTGTWQIENLWDFSAMTPRAFKERWIQPLGDFQAGGKNYLVAVSSAYGKPAGIKPEEEVPALMVGRIDGSKVIPVFAISKEGDNYVSRKDTNGDGRITKADTAQPVTDATGKPLPANLFARFNDLQADGTIICDDLARIWKCSGVDASGVPIYEGKNYQPLPNKDADKEISPYDYKPEPRIGFVQVGLLSDGGFVAQTYLRGSGGTGLNNGAGTDLTGFAADGHRRWVNQMAMYHGIAGMGTVDDITVTAVFYSAEIQVVDNDGLCLGALCETPKLSYSGSWIDHPNMRLFKMPDGNIYMTYGDNASGRHPWYRLENIKSLVKARMPVKVDAKRAAELAALEFKPVPMPVCPQPKFKVAHLAAPMTIDAGLEKWHKAGIAPQIVMGPGGKMKGPGDCSALVRMAYEGNSLYFQVLTFDDIPVFGNFPVWQNSVEIALNGVNPEGMQFIACKKSEKDGDVIWRNRFFDAAVKQMFLSPQKAPCVVKVLDNARDVPEREMLERLYGEDLSKAKVIVTEFKIPIDKETYVGAEKDVFPLGPGKGFWFTIFVDDSDSPYTDQQELINWPVGGGMFNPKEDGAYAVCE